MKKLLTKTILTMLLLLLCISCKQQQPRYVIGVSQCSEDIWREKQNAELRMANYFQQGVELRFASAYDSDQRQIEQIDSLLESGIDLLIVAPNQVATISPAIDRAYDKGIPVIVFERKTNSHKYTAYIGADNYEMGRVMGEYIASQLNGKGRVLEIKGLAGSSPAMERHKGFMDAMRQAPGISVEASLQGDWTETSGYEATRQWLKDHSDTPIDFVFGQNDRMAMGARRAFSAALPSHSTKYCGIDGLPGEHGGIRLVRDSILDASYIYPTHGDKLLQLALDILDGKSYEKETQLMSALVTHDNAKVLLMQSEEIMRQTENLDLLHRQSDAYLHELDTQRVVLWLAVSIIALLLVIFILFYLYHLNKISRQREHVVNTLWNMTEEPVASKTAEPADDTKTSKPVAVEEEVGGGMFLTRFKEVVEAHMSNSEVSVDDLAATLNLSRVQLYRKVKAVTGSSPVELIRSARLKRAYQILLTTDKSVSEVAYEVGFTAPSYFTKCFKDEYGMLPGDIRVKV